jgi:uncharacterized protein with von Willebrand factor type A (vWA) domain
VDPADLEVRYAWLDRLPDRLRRLTVTHVHGEIGARGSAVLALREALLAGRVPAADALAWPEPEIRAPLLEALAESGVAPYAAGDPEVTDDLIAYVLQTVDDAHRLHDRALVAFHVLARKDERRVHGCGTRGRGSCSGGSGGDAAPGDDAEEEAALRRDADRIIADLVKAKTRASWAELVVVLRELEEVFKALAEVLSLPPGAGRGMLRALPRDDVLLLRQMLGRLPALQELIRILGRFRDTSDPDAPTVLERIGKSIERVVPRDVEVTGDRGGVEVRGIERSGEVSRMLPSEAVLLGHPVLRSLWRARWVERQLFTYHAPGVHTQRIQEKQTFDDGVDARHRRAERGPVLVVLDTSASMMGFPAIVSKAIVLQIVGVAFMSRRRCYVYNFSGPRDLIEQELSFEGEGFARMLGFVGTSFDGGTDIDEPLRRACAKVAESPWDLADLVVVSDGDFWLAGHVQAEVRALKRRSPLRIHGIKVGTGSGFEAIGCDTVHEVSDWGVHAVRYVGS